MIGPPADGLGRGDRPVAPTAPAPTCANCCWLKPGYGVWLDECRLLPPKPGVGYATTRLGATCGQHLKQLPIRATP